MKKKISIIVLAMCACSLFAGCASTLMYGNFLEFKVVNTIDLDYEKTQEEPPKTYKYNLNVIVLPFDDRRDKQYINLVFDKPLAMIVAELIVENAKKQKLYKGIRIAKNENYENKTIMTDEKSLRLLLDNENADAVIYGVITKLNVFTDYELDANIYNRKANIYNSTKLSGVSNVSNTVIFTERDLIGKSFLKKLIEDQFNQITYDINSRLDSVPNNLDISISDYSYPEGFKIVHVDDANVLKYLNVLNVLSFGASVAAGTYLGYYACLGIYNLVSLGGMSPTILLLPLGWVAWGACIGGGVVLGTLILKATISDDAIYQKGIDRGLYAGEFEKVNNEYMVFKANLLSRNF